VSKMCAICGKKPMVGSRISHAHNVNKRRFNPNLQRVRALRDGRPMTMVVCCACIKSGRIQKAP
jgi:large subunit ribosomal protein L28